jgi:SWI/SNF-related matrix-associated actin-dependent regulator of chromatin subfamily A member 5
VIDKIEKGERKILRLRQIRDAIGEKIERHIDERYGYLADLNTDNSITMPTSAALLDSCWKTIKLNYLPGTKNRAYTEEEDAFLLCMMHRHGFRSNERIRLEIRRAWQFRFDWYFKSRSRYVYSIYHLLHQNIEN